VLYDTTVDSDALFVTDFLNLKIKSVQYFRCAYRSRVCVPMFIGMSAYTYMSILSVLCFLKKLRG
jgi:hypothetical protein